MTNSLPGHHVLRRLNGRPQACDPCRKRKVACDNTQPRCKRCCKRNLGDLCTYTVTTNGSNIPRGHGPARSASPLPDSIRRQDGFPTSQFQGGGDNGKNSDTNGNSLIDGRNRDLTVGNGHGQNQDDLSVVAAGTTSSIISASATRSNANQHQAYFGFTSHSDVYEQAQSSLSLLQGFQGCQSSGCGDEKHPSSSQDPWQDTPGPVRDNCLLVLRNLHLPPRYALHRRSESLHIDEWIYVALQRTLNFLYESFSAFFDSPQDPTAVEDIARLITQNTAKPFTDDDDVDSKAWFSQFTGPNVRWEMIGILIGYKVWFMQPKQIDGSDLVRPEADGIGLARHFLSLCIDVAMRFTDGNTLLVHLHRRRAVWETMVTGDASASSAKAHSAGVSLLAYLGMHAEQQRNPYMPSLASELKRRLFAREFILDKAYVVFTGRPPILSHRYMSTPLPLDISDKSFLEEGHNVSHALAGLDAQGWSRSGKLYPATSIRARMLIALIRDELIELAIGNGRASVQILNDIDNRETRTWEGFPPWVRLKNEELEDLSIPMRTMYIKLLIRLEHLQNQFLIQRLLCRYGKEDNDDLLLISFEMVSLTLYFWTNMDRFGIVSADFGWLKKSTSHTARLSTHRVEDASKTLVLEVMAYAAPGGGILCMELLNPTFSGPHTRNPDISRSAIVRMLSLLTGFLDWMKPSAPNASLCVDCSGIIQRVLSHTLDGVAGSAWTPPGLDAMPLDFNFDILDTFGSLGTDMMPS